MNVKSKWNALSGLVVLAVVCGVSGISSAQEAPAKKSDAKEPAAKKSKEEKPEPAPPALPATEDPEKLLAYIKSLNEQDSFPKFESRVELIGYVRKVCRATIAAGEKLFTHSKSVEQAADAVEWTIQAYVLLDRLGEQKAAEDALKYAEGKAEDERPQVAVPAKRFIIVGKMQSLPFISQAGQSKFVDEVAAFIKGKTIDEIDVNICYFVCMNLEQSQNMEAAEYGFTTFNKVIGKSFDKSEDENILAMLAKLKGSARRFALPGKPIQISGKMLGGKEFDWENYKGKVVLVDFWATWCGPCIQEMANIHAHYEAYHEKGFEVVGVSLDESPRDVAEFFKAREIPWDSIVPSDGSETRWNEPNAAYYGISSIPATILVNAEGNVVSLYARGPELGRQLRKLLGEPLPQKDAKDDAKSGAGE